MSPKWTLDELAHAGAEHLDADFVAGYDRKQGFPSPEPDLDVLASHGALGPTVVDLGTGTGRFAVAAAARCERSQWTSRRRCSLTYRPPHRPRWWWCTLAS